MYFLWIKNEEYTPALMSLCVLVGYSISAMTISLYGGVFLGEGGVDPEPFGIPITVMHFSSMLIIQLISLILLYREKKLIQTRYKLFSDALIIMFSEHRFAE